MRGQIIKIISDQFSVLIDGKVIICKCRGKFRNENKVPLVGDFVLVNEDNVIEEILPRKNQILRPSVSNITLGVIVTSLKNPDFSTNLLDKLLVQLEINHIKPVICITKKDLVSNNKYLEYKKILNYYEKIGYLVIENTNISELKKVLEDNVTVFLGQTGAGKSTLLNKLFPNLNLKTGEVSLALGRGKHTTRHIEIITIDKIRVFDTPGFSSLSFLDYLKEDVRDAFIEFKKYPCIYKDCMHIKESECNIKRAVSDGKILESRYFNYLKFEEEFKDKKEW